MKTNFQVLHEPFNIHTHVKHFHYYCEVIIHRDGKIEYAVPSHEIKLFEIYARIHNISIDTAMRLLSQQNDPTEFAMHDTGCIYVWYDHLYNATNLTDEQHEALKMLLQHKCIDDKCLEDIQVYSPYYSAYELHKAACHI